VPVVRWANQIHESPPFITALREGFNCGWIEAELVKIAFDHVEPTGAWGVEVQDSPRRMVRWQAKHIQVHEDIYVPFIRTLAVLPYNTMIYYPKLKSNYFHHCWETWHHWNKFTTSFGAVCSTDVQMTWIPHAQRKPKQDKRMEYLKFFRPWSTDLIVSVDQTTPHRINQTTRHRKSCQRSNFNEWAQSTYLLVPIVDGIFYIVLFTHNTFYDLRIGGPLNVGGPWL